MDHVEPQRHLRVFLCHSSNDKEVIRDLYRRLLADGIEPWLDEENILPGQDWHQEITKAIRNVDVVIACFSPRTINKTGYIQKEIKYALDVADEQPEGTIFLIPLKLEECDIPEILRRWQYVNFFEESGYERLMKALRHRAMTLGVLAGSLRTRNALENDSTATRINSLTAIEREIIELVAQGLTNKQIANRLPISGTTVRHLLTSIFSKLGIADRFDLIIYAYRHGLIHQIAGEGKLVQPGEIEHYRSEHLAEDKSVLLISDGTDFAAELGAISQDAGFKLISFPSPLLNHQIEIIEEESLAPYELVILVRGEDFAQLGNERFYSKLKRFVFDGGKLFATSWVAWENDQHENLYDALPFTHIKNAFRENVKVTCRPTENELSKKLFYPEMSFSSSFEMLAYKEGSTLLCEMNSSIPFFGYRRLGSGVCYYLNTCQHYCSGSMSSPLQTSSTLRASLKQVFKWIFESSK
jgi:DNA-binding CsgD family transcriptional regulator